jgi:amidase
MGHHVDVTPVEMGGADMLNAVNVMFFFGFDLRLDAYGKKTGRKPGPDTLEPMMLKIYEWAKTITPAQFMSAMATANVMRRTGAKLYATHDIWLSPTTAIVAPKWGTYNLSRTGMSIENYKSEWYAPAIQYTVPHNIMGTPAASLPLAMHSTGLPIGVQIAGRPAAEHVVLQVCAQLEAAMPWASRVPELHVSRM